DTRARQRANRTAGQEVAEPCVGESLASVPGDHSAGGDVVENWLRHGIPPKLQTEQAVLDSAQAKATELFRHKYAADAEISQRGPQPNGVTPCRIGSRPVVALFEQVVNGVAEIALGIGEKGQ